MWIIEFFIETIVKDSELISLPFTADEELEHCMFDFLSKEYLEEPLVKMKKDIYEQVKSIISFQ